MIATESMIKNLEKSVGSANYICLGSKHKGTYIHKSQIVYIEAYECYTWLHLVGGSKMLSCKPIGYYEKRFAENAFIRIHRSYLINLFHLKSYEQKYRLIYLKGGTVLSVSYRKNRLLSKMINDQELKIPLRTAV